MARLASVSKGGYYPTPLDELKLITRRLKTNDGLCNIIDPCCGNGAALYNIAMDLMMKGADPITYGSELEQSRADIAFMALDHVIADGYETIRTEKKFSLLYLNPPYQEGFSERVETTFLRNLTSYYRGILQDEGLLIYVIPQYVLEDVAGVLTTRFKDIKVYRFTDNNYDTFKQVVVYGRLGKPDPEKKKETYKFLKDVSKLERNALPSLEVDDGIAYQLGSSEPVQYFRGKPLDENELKKDLLSSPVFGEVESLFNNSAFQVSFNRPVLELKPMHYSVATMADSDRGGLMGDHYLVSSVVKKTSQQEKEDEESGEVKKEEVTEYYLPRLRVFSENGVFDLE